MRAERGVRRGVQKGVRGVRLRGMRTERGVRGV